jgi:hypothetical protein
MTNSIIWEKWVDPFGKDQEESKWMDYDKHNDNFEDDYSDTEITQQPQFDQPIKVIASPLGLIPYNEYTAPGKIFNFWVGHTNFNITQEIKSIIEACDGIEILDIFTRYRFRIAVGKCFIDSEVMTEINHKLCNNESSKFC